MDGRSYLKLLIALPVLGAAMAGWRPALPTAPAAGAPLASLVFDQYLVNLRNEPLRPTMWGDFRFTNVGDSPLTIVDLEPSCGCLEPQLAGDKRTYQPGERGLFRVQVATANEEPGPHEYTVTVKYEDTRPHESLVRFKLQLPERKLSVDPPELAFFQYNGQPASRVVNLTDFRGSSLAVTRVSSTSELLSAELLAAEVDEHGHHRIPIQLTVPGRVPPGRQTITLSIETNDPEFSVVRIPVLIDGPQQEQSPIQLIGHEADASEVAPLIGPPVPE